MTQLLRRIVAIGCAALIVASCTPPEPAEVAPGSGPASSSADGGTQSPANTTQTLPAGALTALTACYSSVSSTQSVAHYAQAKGLFAKHGLDVDLVLIDSGTKAATALIAGDVDLCQLAGSAAINAIIAGAPLKVIGGLFNTYIYSLMVAPDIQTAADLRGKSLAVSQAGSSSDFAMRVAVGQLGLDPERDVSIVAVGGQGERLAAVASGQVAGTLVSVPETAKAREMGFHELLDMSTLNAPYQHTAIVARSDFLKASRPAALAFMKALSEAAWQMKRDRQGTIEVIAKLLMLDTTADRAALDETYDGLILKYLQSVPSPTLPGIQEAIDELVAENSAAADVKAAMVADPSLVAELEKDGFFAQLAKGGDARP